MKKSPSASQKGLYASILAILFVGIFTASTAFPSAWNSAFGAIGLNGLKLNEDGFRLGRDLQGGAHLEYQADLSAVEDGQKNQALQGIRDVIERRVNAFGVSEPIVQAVPDRDRIIVDLAGVFDVSEAIDQIGETPILEFKLPNENVDIDPTEEQQAQIEAAQEMERESALDILDRALDRENFEELASELSVDEETSVSGGYVGFVDSTHTVFDGLVQQLVEDGIEEGVVDGLYESTSAMHIVNVLSVEEQQEVEASHILICFEGTTRCEQTRTREEAEVLINEIAGEVTTQNFGEIAAERSDDPTAVNAAGSLGWVAEGQMVEEFNDALFAMRDNRISDVIETDFGFHIIFRQDSRSANAYEIAHIELPWTTLSDIADIDPWQSTELSGEDIRRASVTQDTYTGGWYILLEFNGEGSEAFATITEQNIGGIMGIFLDGELISAPVIQQAIYGGQASITGSFTLDEAKLLAQRLNAGALPVPIELIAQQTVGPTLGQASLDRSVQAALIGFALVAIFMIAYYRLAGLIAVISLLLYAMINLAVYKWLGVTMTLSSIAGFILSIGMAVDANVLIFERLKEELRSGRDLGTAIDEGFRRAWTSIRDGNLTTLIAAGILFIMSTSFIKGFALTLAIGIIVSMLTAIFVTRVFLKAASEVKVLRAKWLYNGNSEE